MGHYANETHQFCLTERSAYLQSGHPSRVGPVWPETDLSSGEQTRSICELVDPTDQFQKMLSRRPTLPG